MKKEQDPAIQELERKVAARIKFLVAVCNFSEKALNELGALTSYSQGSCHTHIKRELKGFHGFDFYGDFGHSMMGGNDIRIEFGSDPVLTIYWSCSFKPPRDGRTDLFIEKPEWQAKIRGLIKNRRRVFEAFKKASQRQKLAVEKKEKEANKLQVLKSVATALRVT